MDLIITGNHDGNHWAVPRFAAAGVHISALARYPGEYQPAVFEIILANLKIAFYLVASLFGGVQPSVTRRVLHCVKTVVEYLALAGAPWKCFVDLGSQLAPGLEHKGFMPVEIGCQLAQLVDFMAQVLNHHFQICHMVIGQALHLLLFADLLVLFLHLCLKLADTVLCLGESLVRLRKLRQGRHFLLVIHQVSLDSVPVDIGLEGVLHGCVHRRHLASYAKLL